VSKLDEAIAPDEERFFAKRMKATTTELNASHMPMLSQPKAVAAVIACTGDPRRCPSKVPGTCFGLLRIPGWSGEPSRSTSEVSC